MCYRYGDWAVTEVRLLYTVQWVQRHWRQLRREKELFGKLRTLQERIAQMKSAHDLTASQLDPLTAKPEQLAARDVSVRHLASLDADANNLRRFLTPHDRLADVIAREYVVQLALSGRKGQGEEIQTTTSPHKKKKSNSTKPSPAHKRDVVKPTNSSNMTVNPAYAPHGAVPYGAASVAHVHSGAHQQYPTMPETFALDNNINHRTFGQSDMGNHDFESHGQHPHHPLHYRPQSVVADARAVAAARAASSRGAQHHHHSGGLALGATPPLLPPPPPPSQSHPFALRDYRADEDVG
jgi:hypothetical protein